MREDGIDRLEVHVAGVCIRGDEVLIVRRSLERRLFPGKWECGGGQVRCGENFDEAVRRQLREELGVVVGRVVPFGTYDIRVGGEQGKIPGLKFACEFAGYVNESVRISDEHSEWRWCEVEELDGVDFIEGLRGEIGKAYEVLRD